MHDPWTWTTGWELTVGVGGGLGEGGQRGGNGDNCNRITIKYFLQKEPEDSLLGYKPIIFSECQSSE